MHVSLHTISLNQASLACHATEEVALWLLWVQAWEWLHKGIGYASLGLGVWAVYTGLQRTNVCHLPRCPILPPAAMSLGAVGWVVLLPWCLAGLRVCWRCCCPQARIQCARKLHSTPSLQYFSDCLVHDCVCFAGKHYVHRFLPERGPNWRAVVRSPRGAPVLACKGECHCF